MFHDPDQWDQSFYNQVSAPDPIVYLQAAVDLWNEAYECGELFELTTDRSEAKVTVEYIVADPDFCDFIGTALCTCDEDDDPCERQIDHSQVFSVNQPSEVNMYLLECAIAGLTVNRWINVYLHELGHVLGMGHVSGLPVISIMGNSDREIVQLYDFDLEQLNSRHPCNCLIREPIIQAEPIQLFQTSDYCPGCRW